MGNLRWPVEGALACQQFLKGIVYEFRVHRIYAAARKVAPNTRDDTQLCVGHVLDRVLLVLRRKVEVNVSKGVGSVSLLLRERPPLGSA